MRIITWEELKKEVDSRPYDSEFEALIKEAAKSHGHKPTAEEIHKLAEIWGSYND